MRLFIELLVHLAGWLAGWQNYTFFSVHGKAHHGGGSLPFLFQPKLILAFHILLNAN